MKNKLKVNKGITLIALVITIIVLLMLAGVAISMLSGENGILSQAAKAKQDTEYGQIKEQIKLDIMEQQGENRETNISKDKLEGILKKYGNVTKDKNENITGVETDKGHIDIKDVYGGKLEKTETLIVSLVANDENKTDLTIMATANITNLENIEGVTYTFYLDGSKYKQTTENTCNYENLSPNRSYKLKVEVENSDGDIGSTEITEKTKEQISFTIEGIQCYAWKDAEWFDVKDRLKDYGFEFVNANCSGQPLCKRYEETYPYGEGETYYNLYDAVSNKNDDGNYSYEDGFRKIKDNGVYYLYNYKEVGS